MLLASLLLPHRALATGSSWMSTDENAPPLFVPPPSGDKDLNLPQLHFSKVPAGRYTTLFAWGALASGDSERFREAIDAAKPIEEIWLFSGGGMLEEGLEIGRIIHRFGLTTRVRHGMACISACNFSFMGGAVRYIEPGAVFGVHMFANKASEQIIEDMDDVDRQVEAYDKKHPDKPADADKSRLAKLEEDIKSIRQDVARTAVEIARFLTEFANIPNENRCALTRGELRNFNIVNTD